MEDFIEFKKELLLSLIAFAIMLLVRFFIQSAIKKFSFVKAIDINRRKVIFILSYMIVYVLFGALIAIIWGVDFNRLSIFISSVLAVLGVGFFAQWSLLSNLTASVILFFNHPVRIGSRIRILDKDFELIGEVMDITGFYFFIKTDTGQTITFPNSLIMQKGIEILDDKIDI
ncbi:mechanosensitive ion channel family protein [Wenyingzhuangia sp. 2_MG-2023]|uniref:mechanosensitive ion channel domain-containing protein n=1 Tax=Wenyingzhuangia sp. 2_MG-2023 TaxID=3062639 RepID=UPI0026E35EA2|nr:mechanosensitive ion channel family protein [Wenyingzhuangia sp. 2_MG-2023]MDO6736540.1 mechanosensitive ion channel family protein [Wenyingzhuangia sp. 2_MG-2023]MDO6801165.1 mechanosensitive ion channel family protein [Wenyingzhuangia sp. 1_MG-2023]